MDKGPKNKTQARDSIFYVNVLYTKLHSHDEGKDSRINIFGVMKKKPVLFND